MEVVLIYRKRFALLRYCHSHSTVNEDKWLSQFMSKSDVTPQYRDIRRHIESETRIQSRKSVTNRQSCPLGCMPLICAAVLDMIYRNLQYRRHCALFRCFWTDALSSKFNRSYQNTWPAPDDMLGHCKSTSKYVYRKRTLHVWLLCQQYSFQCIILHSI